MMQQQAEMTDLVPAFKPMQFLLMFDDEMNIVSDKNSFLA